MKRALARHREEQRARVLEPAEPSTAGLAPRPSVESSTSSTGGILKIWGGALPAPALQSSCVVKAHGTVKTNWWTK